MFFKEFFMSHRKRHKNRKQQEKRIREFPQHQKPAPVKALESIEEDSGIEEIGDLELSTILEEELKAKDIPITKEEPKTYYGGGGDCGYD